MGILGLILAVLRKIGVKAMISSKCKDIGNAENVILPGVGLFDNDMTRLNKSGLIPGLIRKVLVERMPILAICLGMQLFTKKSEEGVFVARSLLRGSSLTGQVTTVLHMAA